MTTNLLVIVEGYSEWAFVNQILRKHLTRHYAGVTAFNLKGMVSLERIARKARSAGPGVVSTMLDYYKFEEHPRSSAEELEARIKNAIGDVRPRRVIPYIQKYEFEALLFADKQVLAKHLELAPARKKQLLRITRPPEDINHDLPPAKLIKKFDPNYKKRRENIKIAQEIGIAKIRQACPRFDQWVTSLENAGS